MECGSVVSCLFLLLRLSLNMSILRPLYPPHPFLKSIGFETTRDSQFGLPGTHQLSNPE
jgi:hypothetical protein